MSVEVLAVLISGLSAAGSFIGGFVGAWMKLAKLEQRIVGDEGRIDRLERVIDAALMGQRGGGLG